MSTPEPRPKPRKAKCVYCGTLKPVTKAGKIRMHYVIGSRWTTTAGERVVCGGSGRPA